VISYKNIALQILSYNSQAAYNCYLLSNGVTEQTDDTCQAWRHRWPALLTIVNKFFFYIHKITI